MLFHCMPWFLQGDDHVNGSATEETSASKDVTCGFSDYQSAKIREAKDLVEAHGCEIRRSFDVAKIKGGCHYVGRCIKKGIYLLMAGHPYSTRPVQWSSMSIHVGLRRISKEFGTVRKFLMLRYP